MMCCRLLAPSDSERASPRASESLEVTAEPAQLCQQENGLPGSFCLPNVLCNLTNFNKDKHSA